MEDGTSGDGAEKQILESPESVEKLDLESIKHLAEVHKLNRQILGETSVWKKLIQRHLLEDAKLSRSDILASERPKARLLADILSLIQASPGSRLEMDLIHAVCERYPASALDEFVDVTCACLQNHKVSPLGFELLETIQATLGPRERRILEVEKVEATLIGTFLTALSSMATRQEGIKMKMGGRQIYCDCRESAEAMANLSLWMQAVCNVTIDIYDGEGEIGEMGWAAIRRAVEHLADSPAGGAVNVDSDRKSMAAGRSQDLKAIWEKVSSWSVYDWQGSNLYFTKEEDGWEEVEGQGGLRKGLKDVIHMTEDEWLAEARKHGDCDLKDGCGQMDADEESETEDEEDDTGPE